MNITLGLTVWRWQIGAVTIRLDIDSTPQLAASLASAPTAPKFIDAVSDFFANRWAARHMKAAS